jgi:molecular chaperone DnaK
MTSEPTLVVDLGSDASSAALVADGQAHLIAEPAGGTYRWPTAVYWDGRQMLVGTMAVHRRAADPAGFGDDFKRTLGSGPGVVLGGQRFRAVEQVAAVLTALRMEAERVGGARVRRAVVTVPAGQTPGDPRRAWMVAAGEAAGFDVVELLAEPVAAAHAADAGPGLHAGDLVLGYDLGAGGCQLALVRIGERTPDVLGHAVVPDCGGRDMDALLAATISGQARSWLDPGPEAAARVAVAVGEFAQGLRHQLSDAPTVEDYLLPDAPPYRIDRPSLATLVEPLLDSTVAGARQLLARHGVAVEDVATVLLTGGAARMPAVVAVLAARFGRPLRRMEEPDLATVRGAARWFLHTGPREVAPLAVPGRPVPLAFAIPGGSGRLLRWLVTAGEPYGDGAVLARVRLSDGALWNLIAAGPGTVYRLLVAPGADVAAGQWLAVAY